MFVEMTYKTFYFKESLSDEGGRRYVDGNQAVPESVAAYTQEHTVRVPLNLAMQKDFNLLDYLEATGRIKPAEVRSEEPVGFKPVSQ